jgi:hypothetical protein
VPGLRARRMRSRVVRSPGHDGGAYGSQVSVSPEQCTHTMLRAGIARMLHSGRGQSSYGRRALPLHSATSATSLSFRLERLTDLRSGSLLPYELAVAPGQRS